MVLNDRKITLINDEKGFFVKEIKIQIINHYPVLKIAVNYFLLPGNSLLQ